MKIIFLGGDGRQQYASEYLKSRGFESSFYLDFDPYPIKNEIGNANIVALPLPVSSDGIHLKMQGNTVLLKEIVELTDEKAIITGGNMPESLKSSLCEQGRVVYDYMDIEPFQIRNALLSAEGAIHYAKEKMKKSVYGSSALVLGFGRIGKILAFLLSSLGARVTVAARCEVNLSWGRLMGYDTFKLSAKRCFLKNKYDLIFNTVPHRIMDEEFAALLNGDAVITDLASNPFGMDKNLAEKYGLSYSRELGIPGRYAPRSAGEIIAQAIIKYIVKQEDTI